MGIVRRVGAVYLVAVALAVAVFFVINQFLDDSVDVVQVWSVLNVPMVIGLAAALIFNLSRKMEEGARDPEAGVTRRYLDVNLAFYVTAAVSILFLHNWFSPGHPPLLANGPDSLDGNHQAWVIWAFVDTALPLVLAATGFGMWREADD